MPTYAKASAPVHALIESVIQNFHPDLHEAMARIGAVMVHPALDANGEPTGPAVTLHGEPCLATIKINAQKDRVDGKPDATITIAADAWEEMEEEPDGEARRRALIDHELYHLIVQVDEESGRFKTDDQGRPLFKMRKHDWTFAGFRVVAERHRHASQEVLQARQLHDAFGNILFDFAADLAVDRSKDSALIRDTFAALLSVGHTEAMARRAIDAVLADKTNASTVAEMIDAIYLKQRIASGEFVGEVLDQVAAEVNAGAMGPGVTATVTKRSRRKPEPAGAHP